MSFPPFPKSLDPQDFSTFLAMVEGTMPDKNTAAHVLLDVAAFACGQLFPDPGASPVAHANLLPLVATLGPKATAAGLASPGKINWGNVLQIILQILAGLGPILGGGTTTTGS